MSPEIEKRVSFVELFFDLVFVFAVTQVAAVLAGEPTWGGVLAAFATFTPFWWGWVGTAVLANASDMDLTRHRLRIFAIGAASLLMTVAVPAAFDNLALFYALSYTALRLVLYQWAHEVRGRVGPSPLAWSIFVTAPLLIATIGLDHDAQRLAWAVIMLGEISSSWIFRRRLSGLTFEVHHLPERYGLVIIIALGESVVAAAGALTGRVDLPGSAALLLSWLLACALWWTYFQFALSAAAHALATAENQARIVRLIYSYGHYLLACSIVAIAVGMKYAVKHPTEHLHGESWLLCGGAALYLGVFTWQRWVMFRQPAITRAPAALVALLLGVLGRNVDGLIVLLLVTTLFVVLSLVEMTLVRRHGTLPSPRLGIQRRVGRRDVDEAAPQAASEPG